MKKIIELQKDILSTLNDEELRLMINIIPKAELIEYIKKNPKKFKFVTTGLRIDIKSKKFVGKLSHIYFNSVKKGDVNIKRMITSYASYIVNVIDDTLFKETSNDNYFNQVVNNNNINEFANLVEKILIELKQENIKLFFKLRGHQLTEIQNEYIEKDLPLVIEKQIIRANLEKQFEREYNQKFSMLEREHKASVLNFQTKIGHLEKQLELGSQEISKNESYINSLIEKASNEKELTLSNSSEMETYISTLKNKIDKLSAEISKNIVVMEEQKIINKAINEELDLKYDEFSILAKKKWESKNKILLKENKNLEKSCEELNNEEKRLNHDIEFLNNRIEFLNNTVRGYVQNIDKNIIENALNTTLLQYSAHHISDSDKYTMHSNIPYTKVGIKRENIELCNSTDGFVENIASNLEAIGVGNQADEMANYIIGILASGLVPLICGYKAREIATAISSAYCGETPYIIALPNGYTNAKELTELYKKSQSNVVLIEDAIGTMNENSILPLLREITQLGHTEKRLMLSVENTDYIKYLPTTLYNYVVLLSIEELYIIRKSEYIYSMAISAMNEFTMTINTDEEYKKINKLLAELGFGKIHMKLRASVVAYTHKLSNLKEAFKSYAKFELSLFCKFRNMYDQLEKNIVSNSRDFEPVLFDVIKGDSYE